MMDTDGVVRAKGSTSILPLLSIFSICFLVDRTDCLQFDYKRVHPTKVHDAPILILSAARIAAFHRVTLLRLRLSRVSLDIPDRRVVIQHSVLYLRFRLRPDGQS